MRASKFLQRNLTFDSFDLVWPVWPLLYIGYRMLLFHHFQPNFDSAYFVIGLGEGFKTSPQNFNLWPLWPFIFILQNTSWLPFILDASRKIYTSGGDIHVYYALRNFYFSLFWFSNVGSYALSTKKGSPVMLKSFLNLKPLVNIVVDWFKKF